MLKSFLISRASTARTVVIPDPEPEPEPEPELSPTMEYGQFSSEWYIAFLPADNENDLKTIYWYNGDGGDGDPTLVTDKSMSGSGTSYSVGYENGSQEVAWGSIVVKVGGVEVARGQSDGTIKGDGVTGTTNHTTGNGTLWVTFENTPASTPTVDYLYSPVFEAGLPKYLNRGDILDGKTNVFIIHKAADNTNYSVTNHFDDAKDYLEAIYNVDTDRRIVAGLSRGGVMTRTLLINRHTQIAGFIMAPTDTSGTIPWSDLYDRGQVWISGQTDGTTAPPNSNYMDAIGTSHSAFRYFPSFTLYDATGHTSALWDTNGFNRDTAPWDWVKWASLWNLDIDKQATQHVEVAEESEDIDDYRAAYRAVSFLTAGATKTALQTRLATLKSTIDGGRKRWYITAGTPSTPGVNQAANFNTGQTYSSLPDDNGVASGVGFNIVAELIDSGTNRVSTATRTGVPGFGFAYDEYFNFAQVGNVNGSVKWTGLNSGKTYRVTVYAAGGNGTTTNDINISATVGGFTRSIFTQLTNTRKLEWTGISPNGSNEIIISAINNNGSTIGAGIQVFMLEEEN